FTAPRSRYGRLRRSRAAEGVQRLPLHLQFLRRHRHFARRPGEETGNVLTVAGDGRWCRKRHWGRAGGDEWQPALLVEWRRSESEDFDFLFVQQLRPQ